MPEGLAAAIESWRDLYDKLASSPAASPPHPYREVELRMLSEVSEALKDLASWNPGVTTRIADPILDIVGDRVSNALLIWVQLQGSQERSREQREEKALEDCRALIGQLSENVNDTAQLMANSTKAKAGILKLIELEQKSAKNAATAHTKEKTALDNAVAHGKIILTGQLANMSEGMVSLMNEGAQGQFDRLATRFRDLEQLVRYGPEIGGLLLELWPDAPHGLSGAAGLLVRFGLEKWVLPNIQTKSEISRRLVTKQAAIMLPLATIPLMTICWARLHLTLWSQNESLVEAIQRMPERLRKAREAAGLTQEAVAKKLDRPPSFMPEVELGERELDPIELRIIAKLYGKPVTFFLTGDMP